MIYAIVHSATGARHDSYLTEFRNQRELDAFSARMTALDYMVTRTHWTSAHAWVRRGNAHDTPLYVDGGRVRRARG
jgi:hypothetical protein